MEASNAQDVLRYLLATLRMSRDIYKMSLILKIFLCANNIVRDIELFPVAFFEAMNYSIRFYITEVTYSAAWSAAPMAR